MLFLASMRETGLSHDIFSKFSHGPFQVIEVKWRSMLNFEAVTLKFCNCSWKFGSSPRKGKIDLCMKNGSKVLIYLTLLYFIFYCTLVSIAKGNIAKASIKPLLKPELFMQLLVQCAVYRHTTKALAQQLKAGGFLFLGIWLPLGG